MKTYKEYKEIPQEVREDVEKYALSHFDMEEDELEDELREDFIDFIREGGDYKKDIDSSYITYTYKLTTDNYKFEVVGQEYIKDSCICDEQMDDVIYVTDLKEEKKAKSEKKNAKKQKNTNDWLEFFKDKSLCDVNEIANELMKYKFPKKL